MVSLFHANDQSTKGSLPRPRVGIAVGRASKTCTVWHELRESLAQEGQVRLGQFDEPQTVRLSESPFEHHPVGVKLLPGSPHISTNVPSGSSQSARLRPVELRSGSKGYSGSLSWGTW